MKKILALLLALLLVLGMFAACGPNDEGETDKNDEEQTETKGDEETEKESDKESEKETDKGSDEGPDNGSNTETPACTHPDADKTYTSVDATNHKVTCKCGATVAETEAHAYDDDADMKCNKCNYDRTPAACTHADTEKTYTKIDATNHKVTCSCGTVVAETEAHTYANDTTAKCDKCDYTRCIHADANGDYKCDNDCGTVIEPEADSILTLNQAMLLANAFENDFSENKYYVTAVITSIEAPFSTQYNNITVGVADGYFLFFRIKDGIDATTENECASLRVGDTITVYAQIGKYADGTLETNAGGLLTAVVPHNHDYDAEGWCTICGGENPEHIPTHTCHDDDIDFVCDHTGCRRLVIPTAVDIELTIPQALIIANIYEHNTYSTGKYYVCGTIESIASDTYGNMTIKDAAGNTLYVYGTWNSDGSKRYGEMDTKPVVGDEVILYGVLGRFNSTLQMKNGWFVDELPAAPCTHENVEYTDTEGATHTWTCKNTECGATGTVNHTYTNGVCVCEAVCGHDAAEYTDNENGTHSWTCGCGLSGENEAHAYVSGVCVCEAECDHANANCTNTDNNPDTHAWSCACGLSGRADHVYDDDSDMVCDPCGYDRTPTGTCTHDEYEYVDNENGTHTVTCANPDCDSEPAFTFTENHNYVGGVCDKCDAVCPHDGLKTYVDNGDGTHAEKCEICKFVINENAGDHNFEGGACTDCEAVCAHPEENYTNNGDGTHTQTCSCGAAFEAEGHTYDGNTCVCGANEYETVTITEANAKPDNTKVLVSGIVVKTESNKSATIIDKDGNSLYAFKLAETVALGDYITIKGAMGTYNNSRQIAQGAAVTIETEIPEELKVAYEIYMLPIILEFYKDSSIDLPTNGSKFTDVAFTYSVPYEDCLDLEGNTLNMDIDSASNSGYIEVTATYGTTEVTASKGYTIRKMEFTSLSQAIITDSTSTDFLPDGTAVNVKGIVLSVEGDYTYIIDANGTKLLIYKSATSMSVGKYYIVSGKMGTYRNNRQLATGATAFEETAPKDYMARYLLDSLMATIKSTYNEKLVINFPSVDGYTWVEIMGQPVEDNVFEMEQGETDQELPLTIVIKYGEGEDDILEATKTVTIKGTAGEEEDAPLATFEFGENGDAAHVDGNEMNATTLSETYGINFTAATKVYAPSYDAMGNSCLKLSTSKSGGNASFSFTVADNVNKVIMYVAGYKNNTAKFTINDTSYEVSNKSNEGDYFRIEIDTSTTKTVNFVAAASTTYQRAMINSIEFYA